MRNIVVMMQTTLNTCIARADGSFWEPFPWGDTEMAYLNGFLRAADTWGAESTYEAIVPWWEILRVANCRRMWRRSARPNASWQRSWQTSARVVFSNTLASSETRTVLRGDIGAQLAELKQQDGKTIMLSCGPATLAQFAQRAGLIDEYLLAVHPAVLKAGPQLLGV